MEGFLNKAIKQINLTKEQAITVINLCSEYIKNIDHPGLCWDLMFTSDDDKTCHMHIQIGADDISFLLLGYRNTMPLEYKKEMIAIEEVDEELLKKIAQAAITTLIAL